MEEEKTKIIEDSINTRKEEIVKNFIHRGKLPLWPNYNAVSRFKSVRRAISKGKVDLYTGIIYPNRPFNNRKSSNGRKFNDLKKKIYGQYQRAV